MVVVKKLDSAIIHPEQNNYDIKQFVDGSWIRLIYMALQQQNLPANNLLSTVGINVASLRELDSIQRDVVLKLYDNIALYSGLDTLPAAVAAIFQLHFLRHTGVIVSDAKSLSDLLEKIIFASEQMNKSIEVTLVIKADCNLLVVSSRAELASVHRTTLEIGLCLVYKIINQIFPAHLDIISKITLDLKSQRKNFEKIFDYPVTYTDSGEYVIVFKKNALATKNLFSTHSIGLEPFVDNKLSKTDIQLLSDIENLMTENIASNNLNIVFVAEQINSSVKTLQRRLKRFNTDFSALLKTKKINHAQMLLKQNRLSLIQISYRLGFNSPSSFSRAFKKWTGVSPSDYQ
ncbi:AraC family transcriptional regulator [Colwellia sp. BRX8-9]|uniref:helix-turn-helix domain-containing protein n=1 Tax=Colwellia sp. BRX8-9 TaxID=2759831 RepID=UPI0015F71F8D|nr:helix-turn-helix transcriptional regulator [Colwellia sp. BRX8-9]MBA6348005.1 helix-turn-helix transcriptional regulator [Colwellia sp. BRX8-9]